MVVRRGSGRLVCLLEGLVYASDLDEVELETLRGYWRRYKMTTGAPRGGLPLPTP
jgi:hypothetical protein